MPRDVSRETSLEAFSHLIRNQALPRGLVGFPPAGIEREIERSLLLLALIGFSGRVIDVGTGAGFPGMPLAICRPEVVLIEPRRKAVSFLEKVKRELNVPVEILPTTAEEASAAHGKSEWADFVLARAVGPLDDTARLCAPLCRSGGKIIVTAPPGETDAQAKPRISGLSEVWSLTLFEGLALSQRVNIMRRLS